MKEFTPTEDLLIELLISRHRLGEPFWPISTRLNPTIKRLYEAGWVDSFGGNVENTDRVALTDRGKARWLSYDYRSPRKVEGAEEIVRNAKSLKERFGGDNFWETDE